MILSTFKSEFFYLNLSNEINDILKINTKDLIIEKNNNIDVYIEFNIKKININKMTNSSVNINNNIYKINKNNNIINYIFNNYENINNENINNENKFNLSKYLNDISGNILVYKNSLVDEIIKYLKLDDNELLLFCKNIYIFRENLLNFLFSFHEQDLLL